VEEVFDLADGKHKLISGRVVDVEQLQQNYQQIIYREQDY
jgi:hypothetical protein